MSRLPSPLMSPSAAVVMISAPGMAGSLSFLGNPGQRIAVAVPGVQVLVEGRRHDLEAAVVVQVAERRRGGEAALDVVLARTVLRTREQRVDAHGEARHGRAVGIPGVDVLSGRVHDLGLHVTVDVADPGGAEHLTRRVDGTVGRRPGVHVRVEAGPHGLAVVEAGQRGAVVAEHPQLAAGIRQHRVELVVAVEVEQPRRGLAARAEVLGVALVERRVAIGEQHLAILCAVAGGVGDHHAHGEGGLVRVLVAWPLRRSRRIHGGAAADARVERGPHGHNVDHAHRATLGRRAGLRVHVEEVALLGLDARRPLELVRVARGAIGGQVRLDVDDLLLARVERLEPLG